MIILAFPGSGKTTIAKKYPHIIDVELSDIKYNNDAVAHLTREQRKNVKRPLKSTDYATNYIKEIFKHHEAGRIALVATTEHSLRILYRLWMKQDQQFKIFGPRMELQDEYMQRYRQRGNNQHFLRRMKWLWHFSTIGFAVLQRLFPQHVEILEAEETLEDRLIELYGPTIRVEQHRHHPINVI